jgi:hypothetical protein
MSVSSYPTTTIQVVYLHTSIPVGWNPIAHKSREHFHPPPVASRTDAEDAQWPATIAICASSSTDRIEERIEMLWE